MDEQKQVCEKYKAAFVPAPPNMKVGIAEDVKDRILPIHGLPIHPDPGTTGWFIWAGGEMLQTDDFFVPLDVIHLSEWSPIVVKFLGLPPGWRFLVTNEHEDVWYDASLLSES